MTFRLILLSVLAATYAVADVVVPVLDAEPLSALPYPIINNAVTSVHADSQWYAVSFNGPGAGRTHNDTQTITYVLNTASDRWSEATPDQAAKVRTLSTPTIPTLIYWVVP